MNKYRSYYYCFVSVLLTAMLLSCIKDDIPSCPPLQIMIDVEDKNYNNTDYIENNTGLKLKIDENLSFKSYINKLFYALYDLATGELVLVKHLHEVTGDAKMATVFLPEDLPFGHYGLIVWGNINSEQGILADKRFGTYDLHMGGLEGFDVYMTANELIYDEQHYQHVVKLKRLKGQLIVIAENFPENIRWSQKYITNVMGNIDYNWHYSEVETVFTERTWGRNMNYISNTFVSPSASSKGSEIKAILFDRPEMETPDMQLQSVTTTIHRNEITVLRYVYNADTGTTDIYILMDDGWSEIVNLEN